MCGTQSPCGIWSSATKRECIFFRGWEINSRCVQANGIGMAETSAVDEAVKIRPWDVVCVCVNTYANIFVCAIFVVLFCINWSKGVGCAMTMIFEATFFLCLFDHKHTTLSLYSVFVRGWTDPIRPTDGRKDGTDKNKGMDSQPTNQPALFFPSLFSSSPTILCCVWPKPCSCSSAWTLFSFFFLRGEMMWCSVGSTSAYRDAFPFQAGTACPMSVLSMSRMTCFVMFSTLPLSPPCLS